MNGTSAGPEGGKPAAIMQLTVDANAEQPGTQGTPKRSPKADASKSPRMKFGKSPRMSTGGFSPATVGKVISTHEFLKAMEKEMAAVSGVGE